MREFSAAAILLFLTGCANLGGTFTVDRFLNKEITGDTVSACIARSYQSWARHRAWVQKNYAGAVELAQRAEDGKVNWATTAHFCTGPDDTALYERMGRYMSIAQRDPARACACGNALVELDRWSCAKPGADKTALQGRLDTQAAACEGR